MSDPASPPAPPIGDESGLTLHPLACRPEGDAYVVGRVDTGTFVALPAVGAAALDLIRERLSLAEVRDRVERDEGVTIDVQAFARELVGLGFVAAIDGHVMPGADRSEPHLPWLRAGHARWLLSRPTAAVWGAVVAAGTMTAVTTPSALPAPGDYFWAPATSLAVLANAVIFIVAVGLHELSHLATARAYGVPARIRLSTRLYHLVVQTDVSGMWAMPRTARFRVYLAGIASDLLLLSGAVLVAGHVHAAPWLDSLVRAVELSLLLGLSFQFHVYMRTDLYFVLQDLLRCRNLHGDARSYLRRRLARVWHGRTSAAGGPVLQAASDAEETRVGRYAWFMAVGTLMAVVSYAGWGIPILAELWRRAVLAVADGVSRGDAVRLLDGVTTIAQQIALAALFAVAFLRDRAARRLAESR